MSPSMSQGISFTISMTVSASKNLSSLLHFRFFSWFLVLGFIILLMLFEGPADSVGSGGSYSQSLTSSSAIDTSLSNFSGINTIALE